MKYSIWFRKYQMGLEVYSLIELRMSNCECRIANVEFVGVNKTARWPSVHDGNNPKVREAAMF
jgi:hypothetical protein